MDKQTINGIDAYNFPGEIAQMLYWMGDNYIEFMIDTLSNGFGKQDPMTEIIAIKNEKEPIMETFAHDPTFKGHAMKAVFSIQVLLKDKTGAHWRLFGTNLYSVSWLDTNAPEIKSGFELEKTVAV
jgi:hypothetical protein